MEPDDLRTALADLVRYKGAQDPMLAGAVNKILSYLPPSPTEDDLEEADAGEGLSG